MQHAPSPHSSEPSPRLPVSAQRAFIYALALPGLGEYYAGARLRGALTFLLTLGLMAWTTKISVDTLQNLLLGQGFAQTNALDILAFLALYALWLWAMFAAVDCAQAQRRRDGDAPQTSVAWAVTFSWLCPGAGQAYVGKRFLGLCLLAAALLGTALEIPMYRLVSNVLEPLINSPQHTNPVALIALVNELFIRIQLNLATACKDLTTYASIFLAAHALQSSWRSRFAADRNPDFTFSEAPRNDKSTRPARPGPRPPFARSTEGRVLGLAVLGWICPGSTYLLIGRTQLAWATLAAYAGARICISALLTADLVSPLFADALIWAPSALRLAALVHSVIVVLSKPATIPST